MKCKIKAVLKIVKRFIDKYLYKFVIFIMDLLNLKFPKNASFLILTSHGLGRNAFLSFLQHCGVRLNYDYAFERYYRRCYMILVKLLFKSKSEVCAISFAEIDFEKQNKLINKINQKLPTIMMVRDPISILKTNINLRGVSKNSKNDIETNIKYVNNKWEIESNALDSIDNRIIYLKYNHKTKEITESKYPNCENLYQLFDMSSKSKIPQIKAFILFNSLYETLRDKISSITFMDMVDLNENNAFKTILNLSKKYNFSQPVNENFFKHKLYSDIGMLFPLTITYKNADGGGGL